MNKLLSGIFARAMRLKATISLVVLIVAAYFVISLGELFMGIWAIDLISFSLAKPLNIVIYMFGHMSPWHLTVNVVSLAFFAGLVESKLSSNDVLVMFLFSGALTAFFFSLINPGIALVGASAGVTGIMASAFVLDFKKTLALMAIVLVLFVPIFSGLSLAIDVQQVSLEEKSEILENELETAIETGQSGKAAIISSEKRTVEEKIERLEEGKSFASGIEIDPFLHSYAAIFGMVYLIAFRRKQTMDAVAKQKKEGFLKWRNKRFG